MGSMGPVLRGSRAHLELPPAACKITKTVDLVAPDGTPAQGTMDVKMLPKDPHGYGYTSGMFDGPHLSHRPLNREQALPCLISPL